METVARARPPIVLIVDDQEWSTRSLESILAPNGFAVMRAYTGKEGLSRARAHAPDVVVIDADLPDGSGLEVCRILREDPLFGASTPVLLTSPDRPSRQRRLEALRAGAWDFLGYPVDAEEIVLRLGAYVRAKFEADRLRDEGLIDELTGLYNLKGLERRAREISSWAYRQEGALACIVLAPDFPSGGGNGDVSAAVNALADTVRHASRISDVVGRMGKTEFAIIAPATDARGAEVLAERIAGAMRDATVELRGGYDAVANVRESPTEARELLLRATKALRNSRTTGSGSWIQAFSQTSGS